MVIPKEYPSQLNGHHNAAALATMAVNTGTEYVLTGNKVFISRAGETDVLVVMARTREAGTNSVSAFVVDATSEGISFGRKEHKMGWNAQPTWAINFDQVQVPLDNF